MKDQTAVQQEAFEILAGEDFIKIHKNLFEHFSSNECILIGWLLNLSKVSQEKWICASEPILRSKMGLTIDQQKYLIRNLIKKGFLFYERRGSPPRRWLQLNFVEIINIAEINNSFNSKERKSPLFKERKSPLFKERKSPLFLSDSYIYEIYNNPLNKKKEEEKILGDAPGKGLFPPTSPSVDIYSNLSKFLYQLLLGKHQIKRKPNLTTWNKEFKSLHEKEGVPIEDINLCLSWYSKHIGEEYIPIVCSARSFHQKFDSIFRLAEKEKGEVIPEWFHKYLQREMLSGRWPWPVKAKMQLPLVAFKSYKAVKPFLKKLNKIHDTHPDEDLRAFVKFIFDECWELPKQFLERWFWVRLVSLEGWKNWDGNMEREVITVEKLKKFVQEWSQKWQHDDIYYNEIMQLLGPEYEN